MFSCFLSGLLFANWNQVEFVFSHIQSYLYCFILLIRRAELKGSLPNSTIAPLGFIILFSCSHIDSKGITVSHLQAVVPYGGSVIIQSILPSGILFIISRQSPSSAVQFFICIIIFYRIKWNYLRFWNRTALACLTLSMFVLFSKSIIMHVAIFTNSMRKCYYLALKSSLMLLLCFKIFKLFLNQITLVVLLS